jgi:hypothetical protein
MPVQATVHESELDAEYFTTLRHDFSHKMTATHAGLGWIGKTDLLVSQDFGPRVRLASLLVDYPLKDAGTPVTESRCGSCRICVTHVPARRPMHAMETRKLDRNEFLTPSGAGLLQGNITQKTLMRSQASAESASRYVRGEETGSPAEDIIAAGGAEDPQSQERFGPPDHSCDEGRGASHRP